jgi:EAL domain-containing protein (putative c-di-GMP-specific phosphodiesterase class I)
VTTRPSDAPAKPGIALEGDPVLEFQPAVDLWTGRLLGFEALLRWVHPTLGLIAPGVLIPWAEANDDILELNAWVLNEACRQAATWSPGLQVAVNCSLVQLRRHRASVAAADALSRSGLDPDRLTVEITEAAVADDEANTDIRKLVELGVHLAVDDVGTSWATLENLRRHPIEIAKIDRSFIAGLELNGGTNRAIVEAIVRITHSLVMSTVAEGVETAEQLTMLQDLGVDVAQGFYFAPSLPADDARELAQADPPTVFTLTPEQDRHHGRLAARRA